MDSKEINDILASIPKNSVEDPKEKIKAEARAVRERAKRQREAAKIAKKRPSERRTEMTARYLGVDTSMASLFEDIKKIPN